MVENGKLKMVFGHLPEASCIEVPMMTMHHIDSMDGVASDTVANGEWFAN